MRYKHFVNADIDVSAMSIGTWGIGGDNYGAINDEDSIAAIRAGIEHGVNLVDTAPGYGTGHSERIVGKAIEVFDRSKIFVSTKCGIGKTTLKSLRGEKHAFNDATFDNLVQECNQSLLRLNTDYIDVYHIHWPDPNTPIEETMRALNFLKEQGKIRFIALSNFHEDQIEECEKYGKVDIIQPPFSMVVNRDVELMKWCKARGIDTLTYGSIGAGILTGKYREVQEFEKWDPRSYFYPYFKEPSFSKVMKVLEVMDQISADTGKPLAQIAINWTVQKDFVSTALVGVKNPKQAIQNAEALDWELTDAQMAALDEAIAKYIDFNGIDKD